LRTSGFVEKRILGRDQRLFAEVGSSIIPM